MAIPEGLKHNLGVIIGAAKQNRVAVLEVKVRATGAPAFLLVGINEREEGPEFVPLAQFFEGDPYEQFDPNMEGKSDTPPPLLAAPPKDVPPRGNIR